MIKKTLLEGLDAFRFFLNRPLAFEIGVNLRNQMYGGWRTRTINNSDMIIKLIKTIVVTTLLLLFKEKSERT